MIYSCVAPWTTSPVKVTISHTQVNIQRCFSASELIWCIWMFSEAIRSGSVKLTGRPELTLLSRQTRRCRQDHSSERIPGPCTAKAWDSVLTPPVKEGREGLEVVHCCGPVIRSPPITQLKCSNPIESSDMTVGDDNENVVLCLYRVETRATFGI